MNNKKVEYITRFFQRISSKAIENYCLTRLWHKLDNDEIKIIPQQYVGNSKEYSLTDAYFPQLKIHIEVNEAEHYYSSKKIQEDEQRKIQIESKTGHKLFVIDCRQNLTEVHKQIDDIVEIINFAILNQKTKGLFKPWQPDIETNPNFWKSKIFIRTQDDVSLNNIEDICMLFDADFNKTKRGYLRLGGLLHPKNKNYLIWWPSEKSRQGWLNRLSSDENEITETHIDNSKRNEHFNEYKNSHQIRIVFFHYKDILGLTSYKFKGVFSYDSFKSNSETGIVWTKISDNLNINLEY